MVDYSTKRLKPHALTVGLVGGSGTGKTEVSTLLTTFEAEQIIEKSKGKTNSSLQAKRIVYSQWFYETQELLVAVKKKETIYSRSEYKYGLINAISKVVIKRGKHTVVDQTDVESDFKSFLHLELDTDVNTRATLTFIHSSDLEKYIEQLAHILAYDIGEPGLFYTLYHSAKNQLEEKEKKDNSAKLSSAIKVEVAKYLDGANCLDKIWDVWESLNATLDEHFFYYFFEQSKDGYYYHRVDLNCVEASNDFIEAFFTSNNLRDGEKLSLEVMCEEIVIYTPLNPEIVPVLKQYGSMFEDPRGYYLIAFLDTKGVFHSNQDTNIGSENPDESYFTELLYNHDYDALLFVCPLFGDANEEKFKNLCNEVMRGFNKQIPLFVLQNKVDLFIDNETKMLTQRSRFYSPNAQKQGAAVIDVSAVMNKISEASKRVIDGLESMQSSKRKNEKITPLICYLKLDERHPQELLEAYNPLNVIETMASTINIYLRNSASKYSFKLESGYEDIEIIINVNELGNLVKEHFNSKQMETKVLMPSRENIKANIGIRPHGSGLNAVERKLKLGIGHNSNINENYFISCKSFNFDLPGILRNAVSVEFIQRMLDETVSFEGGRFTLGEEAIKGVKDLAARYFDSYSFVAKILYHRAFREVDSIGYFDNKKLFTEFLQKCIPYCTGYHFDHAAVLEEELVISLEKAIRFNVKY